MAEVSGERVSEAKTSKRGTLNRKRGGRRSEPRTSGVGRPKGEKKVSGAGVEQLRRAADRRVAQKSEELAAVLLEKALKGKMDSAKMLFNLAEQNGAPEPTEEKKEGPSWAGRLAAEPEWVEPEVGDVWNGDGWVRQKTGEVVDRSGDVVKEDAG